MTSREIRKVVDRSVAVRVCMIVPVLVLTMASLLRADDVVTHWNKVMLDTIAAGGTDPVTSTRTAAIVQAAVFDSINGIQRNYVPIHVDIPTPNGASASAAIIESSYATLVALYPDQRQALRMERKASLAKLHVSPHAIKLGQQYGDLVAEGYPHLAQRRRI